MNMIIASSFFILYLVGINPYDQGQRYTQILVGVREEATLLFGFLHLNRQWPHCIILLFFYFGGHLALAQRWPSLHIGPSTIRHIKYTPAHPYWWIHI